MNMMVTFTKITFMGKVNTFGQMAEYTMDNGLIIKWREKAHSRGVMAEDM